MEVLGYCHCRCGIPNSVWVGVVGVNFDSLETQGMVRRASSIGSLVYRSGGQERDRLCRKGASAIERYSAQYRTASERNGKRTRSKEARANRFYRSVNGESGAAASIS